MDINYIRLDKKLTIGAKRNIGCEVAKHNIIMFMDDDDYYPPMSVKKRVASLIHLNKNLVGCSGLGLLEVNKIISVVSYSSYLEEYYKRFFESTLAFKKSFWEKKESM